LGNNIALYMRLSVDEKEKLESESISNQRLLLRHYISLDKDFNAFNIKEYVDDGYSGTSLNRPALQRLFEDVKGRRVSCIIVKDISRFMRDYITLGDYLENIFPFLGIRFISVNDGYDSKKELDTGIDMGIQFKGLLSDFYAKETAEKVWKHNGSWLGNDNWKRNFKYYPSNLENSRRYKYKINYSGDNRCNFGNFHSLFNLYRKPELHFIISCWNFNSF